MEKIKYKIMVVDDDMISNKVISAILINNGYNLILFSNGHKAIDYLKNNKPDLILLDIIMPEIDGFEVCTIIKKDMSNKGIPIIFLTGNSETEDIVKGFELGAVDYITKPFNSAELLARIKTHLELSILKGLLPICAKCKKIREVDGFWEKIENYIENHSEVLFSHSICPSCEKELYQNEEWYKKKYK
jgi:DNA-binding response OmpR family regulator